MIDEATTVPEAPGGEVVEPVSLMSGVRMKSNLQWNCGFFAVERGLPAEGFE
jgi:hypothetical protein